MQQIYDPVYILRFSIHNLSMGYFEPLEFASFGLLAVAFVSISAPDDEIRKLGYEALGRFKNALEVVVSILMSPLVVCVINFTPSLFLILIILVLLNGSTLSGKWTT